MKPLPKFSVIFTITAALLTSSYGFACLPTRLPPEVLPRSGDSAPRNTHVYIRLDDGVVTTKYEGDGRLWRISDMSEITFELVASQSSVLDKINVIQTPLDKFSVELVPTELLKPSTSYSVLVSDAEKQIQLTQFKTDQFIDKTPPVWLGVNSVDIYERRGTCFPNGEMTMRLRNAISFDNIDQPHSLSYGLWLANEQGKFDFDLPSPLLLNAYLGEISLENLLNKTGFSRDSMLKLALRPMDRAGNFGTPLEIVVNLEDLSSTVNWLSSK